VKKQKDEKQDKKKQPVVLKDSDSSEIKICWIL